MTNVIPLKPKAPRNKRSNVPTVCVSPRRAPIAPRKANSEVRSREHLTPDEVARMVRAAGKVGRYARRDAALILVAYQHGLRVAEIIALYRADLDLDCRNKTLHVTRVKSGSPATHPVSGSVARALRPVLSEFPDSRYVFTSERLGPLSASAVRRVVRRAGELARIPFQVHPHMLRHACGFKLANDGHDTRAIQAYLGHKNIQHTVRYTELAPGRFRGMWD